ncbi:metallophosphoesterase family protein [Rheinheimera sediminis]|uniref:metallophosphoesterase family protein n=1 Tax=Rheinheimera sp. YQF-1 TaxID=2499626 RepID=UPI001C98C43F|nr:metallophosphoesterase [Rheinheimera sp. YQF-1]
MAFVFAQQDSYRLLQISDCHLVAEADGCFCAVQPYRQLELLFARVQSNRPDAVILTGDLTQDHSLASYQLIADLFSHLTCPVFYLPGNHDDIELMQQAFAARPFCAETELHLGDWHLCLLNSKGPTPAGYFDQLRQQQLQQLLSSYRADAAVWLFCHHHISPMGSFIDEHIQLDAAALWQIMAADPRIRGFAHGHCHYAYDRIQQGIQLVGCPASSVQFLLTPDYQPVARRPGYIEWIFNANASADPAVRWQFMEG